MLREVLPSLRTVAILANIGSPNSVLEMREAQAAARTLGLAVVTSEVQRAEDIAPAFGALKGRADALYVCGSPLFSTNRIRINTLALGHATADHARFSGMGRDRRADVLWPELPRLVPARCRLRRQDSAWGETGRHPGRATNQVRSHHKHYDCEGSRS